MDDDYTNDVQSTTHSHITYHINDKEFRGRIALKINEFIGILHTLARKRNAFRKVPRRSIF